MVRHSEKKISRILAEIRKQKPGRTFWKKARRQKNGCWLWNSHLCAYGTVMTRHGSLTAHRISFALAKGLKTIPSGMVICHTCDVPACINPKHLWIGTQSENMIDAVKKSKAKKLT